MRDMRSVNNDCCGLSKGTQSDGLISDTSSEEFISGSSTENLKEKQIFGKIVAKESKAVGNESQNSIRTIHLKTSNSGTHQMQNQCQIYIRWGALLSFGILLWIALWITDVFSSNPFLKEDVATAKKVTLKAGIVKKPVLSSWWFSDIWHCACNSITSVTTLDIVMILGCAIIFVYLNTHIKNKWRDTFGRVCYTKLYKNLYNTGKDENDAECISRCHLMQLDTELASQKFKYKNCSNNLSKFSHGDVRNLMTQDQTELNSKLGEKNMQYLNQAERLSSENRISKSLKGSHNTSNTRKRSRQINSGRNYCNISCRRNNLSRDTATSGLILEKPDFDSNHLLTTLKNHKAKLVPEQSNLTCSIFNKSTSFMSERVETWFEIPNSDQAEKVMHSFDVELEEFFKTKSSSSVLSSGEAAENVQRFDESSFGYKCEKPSKAVISNIEYNRGIISSSPAFRRFLVNLAKDRLSESYL